MEAQTHGLTRQSDIVARREMVGISPAQAPVLVQLDTFGPAVGFGRNFTHNQEKSGFDE
jgi:hypothetical protein